MLAAWLLAAAILAVLTVAVIVHLNAPADSMMDMPGMSSSISRALYRAGDLPNGSLMSSRLLTAWQLDAVALAVLVLLAAWYLTGVLSIRRAGERWPARYLLSFLAGLVVVGLATKSSIAVYDMSLFSAHMIGHLMLVMLAPALLTFAVDNYVSRRQTAMLTARAVPYSPKASPGYDRLMTLYCALIAALVLAMLGMAVFASFATFWPYNLTPSWRHYQLGLLDAEVGVAFFNSLKMAAGTALFGTLLVFIGAYLLEKTKGMDKLHTLVRMLAVVPMAVPGLVLGLGYIFFFNAASNPLGFLYHSLTLLTLCTIVHFYTTGHLTAVTALKALDGEFEAVSASLKVPFYKTFWRVTLPVCAPALIDMARYFFINAMTTISAVVFLYSPETKVASIAILNLDEAGEMGAAAAMAVLICVSSALAMLLFMAAAWWTSKRTQAWRTR